MGQADTVTERTHGSAQTDKFPDLSPDELAELATLLRRLLAAVPPDMRSRPDARIRAQMADLANRLERGPAS